MSADTSVLFKPIKVGDLTLQTSVVLAPLTRTRASDTHVPSDLAVKYYAQRASYPGTLLISEGTIVAPRAAGWSNAPGVWTEEQIAAWKKVQIIISTIGFCAHDFWCVILGDRCRP